jgi:hypothetical protein
MTSLRALTLSQPWATLHVTPNPATSGRPAKGVESRGWKPNVRPGERIAIHAGKGIARDMRERLSRDGRFFIEPFARLLRAAGYSAMLPWGRDYRAAFEPIGGGLMYSHPEGMCLAMLPMGAVVGVATYSNVVPGITIRNLCDAGDLPRLELDLGHYDGEGRWGLVQRTELGAIALPEPIPCRGFQQLWHLDPDVSEQVLAHVRAATEAAARDALVRDGAAR